MFKPQGDWNKTLLYFGLTAAGVLGCPTLNDNSPEQTNHKNQQLQAATLPQNDSISLRPAEPLFAFMDSASIKRNCEKNKAASIVIDSKTGDVLQGYNIDKLIHPASVIKLALLYTVGEKLKSGEWTLDDTLKVREKEVPGPFKLVCIGFNPEKTKNLTVGKAFDAAGIFSDKGACNILGYNLFGSVENAVTEVNKTVKKLGLNHTNIMNLHGGPMIKHQEGHDLPFEQDNYSTVRDLAKLTFRFKQDFPELVERLKAPRYIDYGVNIANRALKADLEWGKTGVINASGLNMAGEKDGMICVVTGATTGLARKNLLSDHFRSTKNALYNQRLQIQEQKESLMAVKPIQTATYHPLQNRNDLVTIPNTFRKPLLME